MALLVGLVWLAAALVTITLLVRSAWEGMRSLRSGSAANYPGADEPADIDLRDAEGWTSLMRASAGGYWEIVHGLISCGADVNARNPDGNTALSLAERAGHTRVAELLRRAGAEEQ